MIVVMILLVTICSIIAKTLTYKYKSYTCSNILWDINSVHGTDSTDVECYGTCTWNWWLWPVFLRVGSIVQNIKIEI